MNSPINSIFNPFGFRISKRRVAGGLCGVVTLTLFTLLISSRGFERLGYRIAKAFFGGVMRNMGGIVIAAIVAWLLVWVVIGLGCCWEWKMAKKKDVA